MKEPILMPTLSATMETGHFIQWLKNEGDAVKKGEAIAEVESDKAVMEVEAFHDGYLAGPLVSPSIDLPVGTVLGYIVDSIEDEKREEREGGGARKVKTTRDNTSATKTTPPTVASSANVTPETTPGSLSSPRAESHHQMSASPYARGLAHELGIDLTRLAPGTDGTIRASQVLGAALGRAEPNLDDGPAYEIQPLTPMQRAIANNMNAAAATPTFRVSSRLSLEPLKALAKHENYSLTLLLARACALSVTTHRRFNAVYTAQGFAQRQQVDVGIAVDVPNGLVTPVLRNVAGRQLADLAEEWGSLKDKAMGKVHRQRLTPEDYRGASFYLSNLGMFSDVAHFDAIVPQGAAAILSVGASQSGVAEFTLNCDHRVVYGADAARFLETLSNLLSDPQAQGVLTTIATT